MSNLGGKRPGAGRKPGGKNLRTIAATELVREAQERFPDYNPIAALIALATDAEKAGDVETARQCHASVLPYTAPRFRPVECDPGAALAYEEQLAEIRARHNARALKDTLGLTGLADRLERADRRDFMLEEAVARVVSHTADVAPRVIEMVPAEPAEAAPAPETTTAHAGPTYSAPEATPVADAALIGASPPAYQPMIPWPDNSHVQQDYDVLGAWGLD